MITLILIILAGVVNACMDALRNYFSTSIFKDLNPVIWNHILRKPRQINVYLILQGIRISLLLLAIMFYQHLSDNVPIDIVLYGITWTIVSEIMDNYLHKS